MTLAFDPSDDLVLIADGLETATLRRRGSLPGGPGERITRALRRRVTTREAAASDGRYTTSDVVWRLPTADLPEPPRPGDVIAGGDGRQWTVLETQRAGLDAGWRCAARSLALVYGLDDAVAILQATYAKGPGGAAEPTWIPWRTGVRARIQPVQSQPESRHESRQMTAKFLIFVEEELALDQTHRIEGPDGAIYKILAVRGAERLGELPTIEAELTPWP